MKLLFLGAFAGATLIAGAAAASPSAEGDWIVEDRSGRVHIAPCKSDASRLCGNIVAMPQPNDANGQRKRDVKNPDPKLRERTILGLPLITGFKPAGPAKWDGGKIYNPQDGKTYASKMAVTANGTLKVSGCVLVICKAQTWTRAN
jgi:uncharacterized protein (DUF2147 family)